MGIFVNKNGANLVQNSWRKIENENYCSSRAGGVIKNMGLLSMAKRATCLYKDSSSRFLYLRWCSTTSSATHLHHHQVLTDNTLENFWTKILPQMAMYWRYRRRQKAYSLSLSLCIFFILVNACSVCFSQYLPECVALGFSLMIGDSAYSTIYFWIPLLWIALNLNINKFPNFTFLKAFYLVRKF